MNYKFHPEAETELGISISYYEKARKGLGFEFAVEVNLAIERILLYPFAGLKLKKM